MSHKKKKNKKCQPNLPRTQNAVNLYDLKSTLNQISQKRSRTQPIEYSDPFSQKLNSENQKAVVGQNIDPNISSQFNSELSRSEQGRNNSELKLEITQVIHSSIDDVKKEFDGKLDKYMTNVTFRWVAAVVGSVIAFIAGYVFIHITPLMNDLKDKDSSLENNMIRVENYVEDNRKEIKKLDSLASESIFEVRFRNCKKLGRCK